MKYQVLYAGSVCSKALVLKIMASTNNKPNLASQKFHRLFAEGMAKNVSLFEVSTISVPPIVRRGKRQIIFSTKCEIENNIRYSYTPIILVPLLRNLFTAVFLFMKLVRWSFSGNLKKKVVVCDILNTTISTTVLVTSYLLGIKTFTIITDLPEMMFVLKEKASLLNRITAAFQNSILRLSSGYVFLTEAMNERMNPKQKPYLIMEGLTDIDMGNVLVPIKGEADKKVILYSGGLYEEFGVRTLLDAFTHIKGANYGLHLYGCGNMDNLIEQYQKKDTRIEYFGYVPNEIVVQAQLKASVLVNPRFTNEEYTKYSFPSKNMEYMVSGVPLVTTRLPGMPEEYKNYVYLFNEETTQGFKNTLESILAKPASELYEFGLKAKAFVSEKKNNKVQAERFHHILRISFEN